MENLLVLVGAALQWFRAQKKFPEWMYVVVVVLASAGIYAYSTPGFLSDWRVFVGGTGNVVLRLLAGTQAMSVVANMGASAGLNSTHPLIPVTNSK